MHLQTFEWTLSSAYKRSDMRCSNDSSIRMILRNKFKTHASDLCMNVSVVLSTQCFASTNKYFIIPEGSFFVSSSIHPLNSLKRGRERSTCKTEQTIKTYKLRCEKLANLTIYFNFINQQFPFPKPIPQSNLTANPQQNRV